MSQTCRDCSKCTERGITSIMKRLGNRMLAVLTLGTSAVVSRMIHSGRKMCPRCHHPLSRHTMVGGKYQD